MFLDYATISVESGSGGDGCVSTRREKHVPRGGPNGGNGGRGGSVYIESTDEMSTLLDFRYRRKYKAGTGSAGGANNCTGADGEDVVLQVPCGTIIRDEESGDILADFTDSGERLLVVQGGKGGKGNYMFRNARNQTPMHATPGKPGLKSMVKLELKLIADIGLVGEPNAGKSTLLSVITAARPKVADYPFTTLVPNLGIVDLGDFNSCTVADIPGLIEGASEGRGLGHEFLRHVERTRALLFLVDPTFEGPRRALDVLHRELKEHGNRLVELPFAIAVTKQDLLDPERTDEVMAEAEAWGQENGALKVMMISSAANLGIKELKNLLLQLYNS